MMMQMKYISIRILQQFTDTDNKSTKILSSLLFITISLVYLLPDLSGQNRIGRDSWQLPEKVIQSLEIQEGSYIADLGSGNGYFTFYLADATGPDGKVYAVDVDKSRNKSVERKARERDYQNIEVILGKHNDPLLQESGIDLLFTCNTFHHLENRVSYFRNVKKYLRLKGRIAIIEFSGDAPSGGRPEGHWVAPEVIRKEMKEAGFTLSRTFDFLDRQSFKIFTPNEK